MRSGTRLAAVNCRRATRSKWNSCRPTDAPNTVRGQLLHGKLVRSEISEEEKKDEKPAGRNRVYVVDVDGKERRFQAASKDYPLKSGSERCRQVLLDFREVGVRVIDDRTLEIRLTNRTPYFLDLMAFHACRR